MGCRLDSRLAALATDNFGELLTLRLPRDSLVTVLWTVRREPLIMCPGDPGLGSRLR